MNDTVEQLSCQELVELVTEYLEDAMSTDDRALFERHLADCGNCREYLEQMRTTLRLTGRLSAESISPEAERELLDAFRDWKER